MSKENQNNKKEVRQAWKPHWTSGAARKLFAGLFSVIKIAAGALATVLLICVVCGFVFLGVLGVYLQDDIIPNSEMLKDNFSMDETSYMHYVDANGNIQQLQRIYSTTDREWASFDEIPQALIDAAVAIEDKRFYEHQGVDWITTVKACAGMFFGSGDVTQDNSVTVRRKIVEIFKAQDFERR